MTSLSAFIIGFQLINVAALIIVSKFKKVIFHYHEYENKLTNDLGFKEPPNLHWGYLTGMFVASISFIGFFRGLVLNYVAFAYSKKL